MRRTGITYPTILRAKRGEPVIESTARLISEATGGEVAEGDIPQVKVGHAADGEEDVDKPRAVA